jgi:hypothetical protein
VLGRNGAKMDQDPTKNIQEVIKKIVETSDKWAEK